MIEPGYLIIIGAFILYYLLILIAEREIMQDPKEIIEKFLSFILLYAGVSLIYYSLTGQPLLNESEQTYSVYIFIIGFIAVLWTVPHLLNKFSFYQRFFRKKRKVGKK